MLEEQKAWKREASFHYIDTAAEMDARGSRTNLVSKPFFYKKMFSARCPHTPDEFTLEMRVDVEGLRMENVLSQPEPSLQCDASPRRLPAVDTGSEEPETPRRSPTIGTEVWMNPEYRELSERRGRKFSLFKPVWVVFTHKPRASGVYSVPTRSRSRRKQRSYFTRCSRGVRETNEEAVATKDDNMNYHSKQAI